MAGRQQSIPDPVGTCLDQLKQVQSSPLDFLSGEALSEKLIELILSGVPEGPAKVTRGLAELAKNIENLDTSETRVVVFGGGTGLSNVIGGDSRSPWWGKNPFEGVKSLFPQTTAIVCVTDDGGSTGELLKDLPLIALGDLRHVLLSSIQLQKLITSYAVNENDAAKIAETLHGVFNYRFKQHPGTLTKLLEKGNISLDALPDKLKNTIVSLLDFLFKSASLKDQLQRPHCLGNLVLAAAIFRESDSQSDQPESINYIKGLRKLCELCGADPLAVLPSTTTPAQLKVLYTNGVMVTGEYKSFHARRGYPMDRVFVEFASEPQVPEEVIKSIQEADILLYAPGSLFTSIIPVLHVPGIANAIRSNSNALKVLVANLWIQAGETDIVREAPQRRFYTSDLIHAYHRNIPGGIDGLFDQVMAMKLQDIPGSILQRYALEEKMPIYFDRHKVEEFGVKPVESTIFSRSALQKRWILQHDPMAMSKALKTLWATKQHAEKKQEIKKPPYFRMTGSIVNEKQETQNVRQRHFAERLDTIECTDNLKRDILDILWRHKDIPLLHLANVSGIDIIESAAWRRSQEWDKIFSFYDPIDSRIKINNDVFTQNGRFEVAFLVALGQSLLGNYFADKQTRTLAENNVVLGKVYELRLRPEQERRCYFNNLQLDEFLCLARMVKAPDDALFYTRLVNGTEGFTPPGVLMGLTYAWYLDNRLAAHVEYKMAILKTPVSGLIPEQVKVFSRRRAIIDFFRKVVFAQNHSLYDEKAVSPE